MKITIDLKKIFQYIFTTALSIGVIWGANFGADFLISLSKRSNFDLYIISFHKVRNSGAAFNLFSDNPDLITALSFLALAGIIFFVLFCSRKLNNLNTTALSILSAGIGMNFYERVTKGYVTDYIDLNFIPNMPVFNVADIFIIVGTILLISALFIKK